MGIFFSSITSGHEKQRQKELDKLRGLKTDDFVKELRNIASEFIMSGDFQNYFKSTRTAKNQCNKILLLLEQLSGGDFYKINAFYETIGNVNDSRNRLNENETRKELICSQIMAYYRKVYDIYKAIEQVFDLKGTENSKEKNILDFKTIGGIQTSSFNLFNNLCQQRIDGLTKIFTKHYSGRSRSGSEVEFQDENKKKICDLSKSLSNNSGINYMEWLYNDVYNLSNKKFENKSENILKIYNQDLQKFQNKMLKIYPNKDASVKASKFSDITIGKLPEEINTLCNGTINHITIDANDSNYIDFQEIVRKMEYNYHKYLLKLHDILHTLFTKNIKDKYLLNPELKKVDIDELADRTALTIQNMYLDCEFDYIEALKKLEAIIETRNVRRNLSTVGYY